MANKNKLSIYLVKKEYISDVDIIQDYTESMEIDGVGNAYWGDSYISKPKWASSFFNGRLDDKKLFVSNARIVLLTRIQTEKDGERIFAVVMGYGKNMLKDNVVEERFGLKVVLNTIKEKSLRRINRRDIGGNQKLSNEQLPLKSGIDAFGVDIHQDLVSFIAGESDDAGYATGVMAGGDILSLTAPVDITNICEFLKQTYSKYVLNNYRENFAWIDQIQDVKDTHLLDKLNKNLIDAINNNSKEIFMAVPEIIEFQEIRGFQYYGHDILNDILIEKVKESLRSPLKSIDQLKNKQIFAISALDDSQRYKWSAVKCLFGEMTLGNNAYCINNGKWYCLDRDFVKQINRDYVNTPISSIEFDDYTDEHDSENSYSTSFVDNHSNDYILMDKKNISYGGGHSKIELCDILSSQKELIHIKPYSGSATLSHLFNQAFISAELLLSDTSFLRLANEEINKTSRSRKYFIDNARNFKIVIGIIKKEKSQLPSIPFFSKISFRYIKNRLIAYGFNVSIKTIQNKNKL